VIHVNKVDEVDDFENFTIYAAAYYFCLHLEQEPRHNKLFVCKFNGSVAMETGEIRGEEQKKGDSDVSSIRSSASRKRK
jgi:hypothetical protein